MEREKRRELENALLIMGALGQKKHAHDGGAVIKAT